MSEVAKVTDMAGVPVHVPDQDITPVEAADWTVHLLKNGNSKQPASHMANVVTALELAPELANRFGLNTMTDEPSAVMPPPWVLPEDEPEERKKIEAEWKPIKLLDADYAELMVLLNQHGMDPGIDTLKRAVYMVSRRHEFNPLQKYLRECGEDWDGTPRLETELLTALNVKPTQYAKAVVKRWLISGVARAMDPGCKVDTMLVLEGAQGVGKSTALATLAGRPYFLDSMARLSKGKEAREQLRGKFIVEMAELDNLSDIGRDGLKAFLSQQVDNYRSPYGFVAQDHPRRAIFAGTTNETEWLTDPTGNRRFWPVAVTGPIKVKEIERLRDQIWGEAFWLYGEGKGEQWHLTPEEEVLAKEQQERRRSADILEDPIWQYITENRLERVGKTFLIEHLKEVGIPVIFDRRIDKRLNDIFRALPGGWEKQARQNLRNDSDPRWEKRRNDHPGFNPGPKPEGRVKQQAWTCTDTSVLRDTADNQ